MTETQGSGAPIERLDAALSGRYRIERELGQGGMATVYLADDLKHDRKVALKVLKPELAAVVGGDRFLAEIRTTANLQHPHILPLFDSGAADGFLYYVMPYVEGESLRDRLDREKQLPVDEALAIATKVAGALHRAHEAGVIHRDVKPANILLGPGGEPLVSDFGIALAVQEAGGGRLTETGLSLGTPYYMSPEQATADRAPDPRADVYSLACVLYEMLTGDPPFTGSSAQAVLGRILTAAPEPISRSRPSVPGHVDEAVRRALEKLPADRPNTAADFVRALGDAGARAPDTVSSGSRSAGPAKGGMGWLPWTVAAVSLVMAAIALVTRAPEPATTSAVRFILEDRAETSPQRGSRTVQLSADGRSIVYRGLHEGRVRLFHRSLDRPGATPINGTDDPEFHAISPDGRWVAFVASDGAIRRVPLSGGSPLTMVTPAAPPLGITWSGPDRLELGMLAYQMRWAGITTVGFGDTAITIRTNPVDTAANVFGMHHEPYALPGGTHALYLHFDFGGPVGLGVAELESGEVRVLDLQGSQISPFESIVGVSGDVLLYIDVGGRLMAVRWDPGRLDVIGTPIPVPDTPAGLTGASLAENGTLVVSRSASSFSPVVVDDRGQIVRRLGEDGVPAFYPRVSPDGVRAAATVDADEIYVTDFATGVARPTGLDGSFGVAVWSDGGRGLMTSDARTTFEDASARESILTTTIIARPVDFSAPAAEVLTYRGALRSLVDVTPDGRYGVFVEDSDPNPAIVRADVVYGALHPDSAVRPIEASEQNDLAARLSPGGEWVAYSSLESGRSHVYVRPFPGPGPRVQVSLTPAGVPVWDPEIDRLYYRTDDGLYAADFTIQDAVFTVTARARLFDIPFYGDPSSHAATYDVHPEGFLLAVDETGTEGQIVVWTNWLHEVRALLDAQAGS